MSRIVLITGGSKGIGLATAQAFAAQGDRVAVTYHSSPPPHGPFAVKCDVTDSASVDEAFTRIEQEFGSHVEVLVCAAGITRDRTLMMMKDEDLDAVINTNLKSAFYATRRAFPKMRAKRFGRIVFISSVVGRMGAAGQSNYAATKAGLHGMSVSLAREFGPKGVTVNVVAPGLTNTDMAKTIPQPHLDAMVKGIPVGRIGEPEDIARAILFLTATENSYINGAYLAVDGGAATGH